MIDKGLVALCLVKIKTKPQFQDLEIDNDI